MCPGRDPLGRQQRLASPFDRVDCNPEILQVVANARPAIPKFNSHSNLLDLPYPADSFDFVLCSLALHHFAESDVVCNPRRIPIFPGPVIW